MNYIRYGVLALLDGKVRESMKPASDNTPSQEYDVEEPGKDYSAGCAEDQPVGMKSLRARETRLAIPFTVMCSKTLLRRTFVREYLFEWTFFRTDIYWARRLFERAFTHERKVAEYRSSPGVFAAVKSWNRLSVHCDVEGPLLGEVR